MSAEAETPELLSCYLAFIGRGPLLTRREEVILGRRVRSGDRRGRRKLRLEPIVRSTPRLSSSPRNQPRRELPPDRGSRGPDWPSASCTLVGVFLVHLNAERTKV